MFVFKGLLSNPEIRKEKGSMRFPMDQVKKVCSAWLAKAGTYSLESSVFK